MSEETIKKPITDEPTFTEEEIENILGLCDVLRKIRSRLLAEGMTAEELKRKIDVKSRE